MIKKMDGIPNVILGAIVSLWRATCESALRPIYGLPLSFYLLSNFGPQPGNFSCVPEMDVFPPSSLAFCNVLPSVCCPESVLIIMLVRAAFPSLNQLGLPYQTESTLECSPQQHHYKWKLPMTARQIFVRLLCIIYVRLLFWNAL